MTTRREPARMSLTTVERDPNLVCLRVGRKRIGELPRRDAEMLGLRDGEAWSEAIGTRIQATLERTACRRDALKLLSVRARFARELRERLVKKGFALKIAEEVTQQLVEDGWIDEATQAKLVAETWRRKGQSASMMRRRLERAGAGPEAIAQALSEPGAAENPLATLAAERLRTMKSLAPKAAGRGRFGYLARRGHEEADILDVFERLGLPVTSVAE